MKLLNIDANAKTVKGQKRGYMTAVLYLAPYKASGYNVCPFAEKAGCYAGCLNTAGRGGIAKASATIDTPAGALPDNAIQRARIARTKLYFEDRKAFMAQLRKEIDAFLRKAKRANLIPAIRLNGTSDIEWERRHPELFEEYSDVQFYDYTKVFTRFERGLENRIPPNYHLSLSYSEADDDYRRACDAAHEVGVNLVAVARDKATKARYVAPEKGSIDGDEHDLRFLDPDGSMVWLYAKGAARKDDSGFVID
jgi:hypothetical protein